MRRGRRSDGERNREAVLDAASRLLAERPDAPLADVAVAAGVTRATVYRHFASRDALLDEVLLRDAASTAAEVFDEIGTLPLPEAMDRMAQRMVEFATAHERIVAATRSRIQQLARGEATLGVARDFLAARRRDGEIASTASDDWLARCLMLLCLEVVLEGDPAPGRAEELAATLRAIIS